MPDEDPVPVTAKLIKALNCQW